jgi:hypothetical protein
LRTYPPAAAAELVVDVVLQPLERRIKLLEKALVEQAAGLEREERSLRESGPAQGPLELHDAQPGGRSVVVIAKSVSLPFSASSISISPISQPSGESKRLVVS